MLTLLLALMIMCFDVDCKWAISDVGSCWLLCFLGFTFYLQMVAEVIFNISNKHSVFQLFLVIPYIYGYFCLFSGLMLVETTQAL